MTARRVICAVMVQKGRVLLARRAPGQSNAGLWEFPGGKVEQGETDRQCLEREMAEEFGVAGAVGAHVCDSEFTYGPSNAAILLRAYFFTPADNALELRVHDRAAWFSPAEVQALPLSPADIPIADAVIKTLPA